MSTKTEHTKTPFTFDNQDSFFTIRGADGRAVAVISVNRTQEQQQQDAAFIVRACNSFEKLVEALEEAMSALCAPLIDEPNHRHNTTRKVAYEAKSRARAILESTRAK
jgi:hypothetical protein